MKKTLLIVLAVLISVAFVTTVFAQQAPKTEKPAAAPEKAPAPEKPAKEKAMHFKGEFVSADAAAKTIVVKGKDGEKTFDVSGVKKMAEFKAGEKVVVMYTEKDGKMMASKVTAKKAPAKKAEKKEEAKPAPAPEAAPAPAKK